MNLQKLLTLRAANRSLISSLLEQIHTLKEDGTCEEFSAVLQSLVTKAEALLTLDDKVLSQTDVDGLEEEVVSTGVYTMDLELKLTRLRRYQKEEGKESRDGRREETSQTQAKVILEITEEQEKEKTTEGENGRNIQRKEVLINGGENRIVNCEIGIEQRNKEQRSYVPNGTIPELVSNDSFSSANSAQYHRLPKLSLPTFDGNVLNWQTFWDSFESTVHSNPNLTDVQKFSYLKSQLNSEAARTIDGFALTHTNYLRAIELLHERYGQKHKIIHATMQALLQLPAPTQTLHSMKAFYDNMETYVRGLESLGQHQETYGDLLVPIVLDKLPEDTRKHLARDRGDSNWFLGDLRRAIKKEIYIMEAGMCTLSRPETEPYGTATSFFTGANHRGKKTTPLHQKQTIKCAFCEDSHTATECRKYSDVTSRLDIVKKNRLCFNCLGKHKVSICQSKNKCRKCNRKHHTSICSFNKTEERSVHSSSNRRNGSEQVSRPDTAVLNSFTRESSQGVLLKTAISTVSSGMTQMDAHILFDEGAQKSFITESLANELEITRTGTETVHLATFGKQEETMQHLDTATVLLITDRKERIPIRVLIVPSIATPLSNRLQHTASQLPYLQGLRLAHPVTGDQTFTISMLIGADHYWDIIEDRIIRGNGPTAVKSKIGYLLSGPVNADGKTNSTDYIFNVIASHSGSDPAIERFWSLESMGISSDTEEQTKSEYLTKYQQTSIELTDGKYTASLPWKADHEALPSNYEITRKRTESTVRRLSREPDMLQKYGKIIKDQEHRGFIERVDESAPTSGVVHYIPHHPVKKESSTTPIRIVYDCSCRQSSEHASLNDCLESTPPILNELTSILMRFRIHKYAVTTDIEKAFLHIALNDKDRDATRFLWLSDPSDPDSPLCTYRFKAVLFGATCSPFILNATILKHLELNKSDEAAETIERDLYVDNVLSSFQKQSNLTNYFRNSRDLMKRAGMNLRSWSSNSPVLRDMAAKENVLDSDEIIKILGMRWKPEDDNLTFAYRDIPELDIVTKRDILTYSSRIYDPLGLLSPVTVRAKLLLQQLWKGKYEWDMPLPTEVQDAWNELVKDLNAVTRTTLSRQFISDSGQTQTDSETDILHLFVDASIKSYGAAVYIASNRESRLVIAKNRVAPLKSLTLPQLELMAAVIGARLIKHVQQSLGISEIVCWSNSQIVLYWLSTEKQLKRFVRNRVQEIQTLTKSAPWRYCPTHDNPADLLTRGIQADKYKDNTLWNTGPSWITRQSDWPVWTPGDTRKQINEELNEKVLKNCTELKQSSIVTSLHCKPSENVHEVIDIDRFSKYAKLLRVTAYVIRFIENCKNPREKLTDALTIAELKVAERKWLKSCQENAFTDELVSLKSETECRLPLVKQLRLFVDNNGLIRCGGRIHNAHLSEYAIFPYLLPRTHPLTRLIVVEAHEKQLHTGVNGTMTHIRQNFWIPAIRQCVRSVLRKCVICKRVQGKPYKAPDPPPLPKVRVEESPPFTVTGVDYTGALIVKDRAGRETKVYICLFTCACTRAVHLEIVQNLSTDSFIQAFRRFASRRSVPKIIISDNATTFVGAAESLRNLFEWRFIPKRAPWYGGFWERLIGLTKNALKKILGRAFVSIETLQTVVTEIEAVLNDRPITYVSSSFDDMEPLTPSHLLYGRKLTSLPQHDVDTDRAMTSVTSDRSTLIRRANNQANLIEHFWRRWTTEYLTALREHHGTTGSNETQIRVGDVVQIHDEGPRLRWKIAVINDLIYGNDGLVRAAQIKTMNGLTTRPVVKLYPLETV